MSAIVPIDPRTAPLRRLAGSGPDWVVPAGECWMVIPLAGTASIQFADGRAELRRGMVYVHAGTGPAVLRRSRRLRVVAWPLRGTLPAPLLAGVHDDRGLARTALAGRGEALRGDDRLSQYLAALAGRLLASCPGRSATLRARLLQRLWRVRQRVLFGPDDQVELDALAAAAVLSKFHFVRCFTRVFGSPPVALRRETRLRQAALRVAEPDLPLATIAAASGFQHPSSFARAFRRRYGVCASDARKSGAVGVAPAI